jgi:hypothetical protein
LIFLYLFTVKNLLGPFPGKYHTQGEIWLSITILYKNWSNKGSGLKFNIFPFDIPIQEIHLYLSDKHKGVPPLSKHKGILSS